MISAAGAAAPLTTVSENSHDGVAGNSADQEEGPVIAEAPTWRPAPKGAPQPQTPPEEVVKRGARNLDPLIRAMLNVAGDTFPDLWAALTPVGRRSFVTELVEAAMSDGAAARADRVGRVVGAWYQTMVLRSDPDYEENAELARQEIRHPKRETVEELRRQLA